MPRYALMIEYDGGPFQGWQRQLASQPSVQGVIETALGRLHPGPHVVTGAGRTDAGVHATGQVAHVDLPRAWDPLRLAGAINAHLRPWPVAVLACAAVTDDFHARFSARERRYLFRLLARRAPAVLDRGKVWQVPNLLDRHAMQLAAAHLIGKHDFTTFRSSLCQAASPVKTMNAIGITEHVGAGGVEYRFTLSARSFLHNQVRSIIGSLERVGSGRWPPDRMHAALQARDRTACGPVCPPQGLYLTSVGYPGASVRKLTSATARDRSMSSGAANLGRLSTGLCGGGNATGVGPSLAAIDHACKLVTKSSAGNTMISLGYQANSSRNRSVWCIRSCRIVTMPMSPLDSLRQ